MNGSRENSAPRLPYLPALDGLRALAVLAVLLYHGGQTWLPGGFLGVEMFFVISGYLITSLLLAEWNQDGRVDFKASGCAGRGGCFPRSSPCSWWWWAMRSCFCRRKSRPCAVMS